MRENKQLILATKPFAVEHRPTSWMHFGLTLALLVAAYAVIFSPVLLLFKAVASILVGLLLVRMFMIYHDYLHRAILHKSPLAKMCFTFYGMYILAPTGIWQRSHDHHHKNNSKLYTSSIGSYPIVTRRKFLAASRFEQNVYLFTRHPLTILLGYVFSFAWGMCFLSLVRNPARHWDSGVALVVHFSIGITIFLVSGWLAFLLAFLVPAILSSAIGSYLFYAQHNFPGATFSSKEDWTYANAAMESSSYMKGGALMRWFTANIGYHHVHHANARIPFYRLREVHHAIPEFQAARRTSLAWRDIAGCLRMKVWDPDAGRMISLQELRWPSS